MTLMARTNHLDPCAGLFASSLAGCGEEDRAETYLQRGQELFDQGNLVKARLEFKNALQIDPKQARGLVHDGADRGAGAELAAGVRRLLARGRAGSEQRAARLKKGAFLLAGEQYDDALAEAEAVLTANPGQRRRPGVARGGQAEAG